MILLMLPTAVAELYSLVTVSIFDIYLTPKPYGLMRYAYVPFNNISAVGNCLVPILSFNLIISILFNSLL